MIKAGACLNDTGQLTLTLMARARSLGIRYTMFTSSWPSELSKLSRELLLTDLCLFHSNFIGPLQWPCLV
jgi:hypothetical protein